MNDELRALYVEDEADRAGELTPQELLARDATRRARVDQIINAGHLEGPDDHFHAAMVLQHGPAPEHAWRAHVLARTAAQLGVQGAGQWYQARALAAAAYDRWLVQQGRPQRYGTQYQAHEGRWELYEVDPATTDAERAEWGVAPLHEAIARAVQRTALDPPRVHVDGLRLWPFSTRARRSLAAANAEATRLGQRFIGPEHLLLGILDDPGNSAARLLDEAVGAETLRARLIRVISDPGYDAVHSPAPQHLGAVRSGR